MKDRGNRSGAGRVPRPNLAAAVKAVTPATAQIAATGSASFAPLAAKHASTAAQTSQSATDSTAVQNWQDQKVALPERRLENPQFRQSANAGFAVSGHGWDGNR